MLNQAVFSNSSIAIHSKDLFDLDIDQYSIKTTDWSILKLVEKAYAQVRSQWITKRVSAVYLRIRNLGLIYRLSELPTRPGPPAGPF